MLSNLTTENFSFQNKVEVLWTKTNTVQVKLKSKDVFQIKSIIGTWLMHAKINLSLERYYVEHYDKP